MKKFAFVVIIIMILILSTSVLAGDIPESVMMENDVDVIIGTVTDIHEKQAKIQVSKTFFEVVTDETIVVQDFEYLVGSGPLGTIKHINPEVGDFCAVAVIPKDETLIVYGGLCAKADSLDSKTLKLDGGNEFIARMNEYINTEHYSKEKRSNVTNNVAVAESSETKNDFSVGKTDFILFVLIGIVVIAILFIGILRFRKR